MHKARRAICKVSGELLHGLLQLPETVEVMDAEIKVQGDLPESCIVPEGACLTYVDLSDLTAKG